MDRGSVPLCSGCLKEIVQNWAFFIGEDLWGKGYCTEACVKILPYCKDRYGITDVFAFEDAYNEASVRVLKKLGFEHIENELYKDKEL